MNGTKFKRGQIWWFLPEREQDTSKCIQTGTRPVIIVSNDTANKYSPILSVCPLTTKIKKNYPTQVPVIVNGKVSVVLCNQIFPASVDDLDNLMWQVEGYVMENIDRALGYQLGLLPIPMANHSEEEYAPLPEPIEPIAETVTKIDPPKIDRRLVWTTDKKLEFLMYARTHINSDTARKYNLSITSVPKYISKFRLERKEAEEKQRG